MQSKWRSSLYAKDLHLIHQFHSALNQQHFPYPLLRSVLAGITNNKPFKDITMITWMLFSICCWLHGFSALWAGCLNLIGAWLLRSVLRAPRPFLLDARLKPAADRYKASYGFPSMETHMATVIYGWLAWKSQTPVMWIVAVLGITLVGLSRVFACSRFIHQVFGSAITGWIGLTIAQTIHLQPLIKFEAEHHMLGIALIGFMLLGVLSLWIESNDSTFIGITRKEYVTVLQGMMINESGKRDVSVPESTERDGMDNNIAFNNIDTAFSSSQLDSKKDSLYWLKQALNSRKIENRKVRLKIAQQKRVLASLQQMLSQQNRN